MATNQIFIESGATDTIKVVLDETTDKQVYLVLSGSGNFRKVYSTADGSLIKAEDGLTYLAVLTSDVTKQMNGKYYIELAIKSEDNSFVDIASEAIPMIVSGNNVKDAIL